MIKTVEWKNNFSRMIDQRILPYEFKTVDVDNYKDMFTAIKDMIVRGAPAIGIAGVHGVALAALEAKKSKLKFEDFKNFVIEAGEYLISSRPTAVNLVWGVRKQLELLDKFSDIDEIVKLMVENAINLENEDIEINKKMGSYGKEVIPKGGGVLTHCNAGALATVGYGTALGVIRAAYERDNTIRVYADETRPRLQGAKLTAFELIQDGIVPTLLTDGMCSYFMSKKLIDVVVTGADRIAANGDTANKIGTSTLAIVANYYKVPFYIAAPLSTIDRSIKDGSFIKIEERSSEEVTHINGNRICAEGVKVINPGFDVTDNKLIAGIITEKGILLPPFEKSIKEAFEKKD